MEHVAYITRIVRHFDHISQGKESMHANYQSRNSK